VKAKPKRTDKVLMGIFLAAVVVAVLIAAIAVFDPTGLLRAGRPGLPTPPHPRTPELQACADAWFNCVQDFTTIPDPIPKNPDKRKPNPDNQETCRRNAYAAENKCRIAASNWPEPQKSQEINQCGVKAAEDFWNCTQDKFCKPMNNCDNELSECVSNLKVPQTSTPPSS
jgi:hypothetical protein